MSNQFVTVSGNTSLEMRTKVVMRGERSALVTCPMTQSVAGGTACPTISRKRLRLLDFLPMQNNRQKKPASGFSAIRVTREQVHLSEAVIMPPIPPMPPMSGAGAAACFGQFVTMHSVVIIMPATEAPPAVERVTFAGSRIPISSMSPYSPVPALKPNEPPFLTLSTTTSVRHRR